MTTGVMVKSASLSAGGTTKLDSPYRQSGIVMFEGVGQPAVRVPLVNARLATGLGLTATAGSGNMGLARTAGTSLKLVGEATSGDAKTNAATLFAVLPMTYVAGTDITVVANAATTGAGTLTAASTTITLTANSIIAGVEAALTVTGGTAGAIQFGAVAADLTWTITGTTLLPGMEIALIFSMLVTSSSGANTGQINSVTITP